MHISFISAEFPPVWGGIGAFTSFLATTLVQRGHRVSVYTRKVEGMLPALPQGLDLYHIPCPGPRAMGPYQFGQRALQALTRHPHHPRPDVLHLSYPLLAVSARRLHATPIPTVATFHGTWQSEWEAIRGEALRRLSGPEWVVRFLAPLLRHYERVALLHCTRLTTISEFCRDNLIRHYQARRPIAVIPNGVDLTRFAPCAHAAAELRRQYQLSDDTRILLAVGRLVSRKGYDLLLKAFSRMQTPDKPLALLIVGVGPLQSHLRAHAATLSDSTRIIFCGTIAESLLPLHYAGADIFVLPSRFEGFGMVYLEAMACATPVVAPALGGIGDVVVDGQTGVLTVPESAEDLADKCVRLLADTSRARAMGAQGRLRAESLFSWDHIASRFEEIYRHE